MMAKPRTDCGWPTESISAAIGGQHWTCEDVVDVGRILTIIDFLMSERSAETIVPRWTTQLASRNVRPKKQLRGKHATALGFPGVG
jgi:hypothetical protein